MEKRKVIRNLCLLACLLAFALWFALHKDAETILAMLSNMKTEWVLFVMFMGILYYVMAGVNITWIARKYDTSYGWKDGIVCAYSCALFNGITPLGCGQVAQSYVLHKQGIKVKDGLSILWLDFIVFQSVILVYVLALLAWKLFYYYEVYSRWFLLVLAGFLVNSFVIVVLYTFAYFPKVYQVMFRKLLKIGAKLHLIKHPHETQIKWEEQLRLFQSQLQIMKEDKLLLVKCVIVQVLRMTLYYAIPFFAAKALQVEISWQAMGDIIAMSSFIHMLNALTPLPGDTGWSESAFVMIFATMFSWNQASAIMLVWRFSTYHFILILGAVMFLLLKQRKKC